MDAEMVEAAAISRLTTDATPRWRNASPIDDAPAFSYALAAASLERQAAQSLQVHGATPTGDIGAAAKSGQTNSTAADDDQSTRASDQPVSTEPRAERATPAQLSTAAKQATIPSGAAATPPAIAPSVATPATAAIAAQTRVADSLSIRDALPVKNRAALEKAPRALPEPATLKAAFAEILARRLEKTSIFDLRLDPPEMGRVEGRLAIDDSGKAVLSLTFDNQNAFGLYSRNEQALRQALYQAGLNFAAGDFVFSFKQPAAVTLPAPESSVVVSEALAPYEPIFSASWSAGALDIRI